jgi:hypothetical protein
MSFHARGLVDFNTTFTCLKVDLAITRVDELCGLHWQHRASGFLREQQ